MMAVASLNLLGIQVFVSCIGLVGNLILIISISQTGFFKVKTFEFFLLGLALSNLEEILIVNIYDIIILQVSFPISGSWFCHLLKFLTVLGEVNSVLFTVLISIFRYQKVKDATKRVNLPIYLDNIRSAWMVSGVCVMLSTLLSMPTLVIDLQHTVGNFTGNNTSCPPDFFQCIEGHCPIQNRIYKYIFVAFCNLLPMVIVTITSCLIMTVLLSQRKTVTPGGSVTGSGHLSRKSKGLKIHRSTIAVLAAMGLFQVDWTLYLLIQLIAPTRTSGFSVWDEIKFFITTSYTSISPYVYGIGNNLISVRTFRTK